MSVYVIGVGQPHFDRVLGAGDGTDVHGNLQDKLSEWLEAIRPRWVPSCWVLECLLGL